MKVVLTGATGFLGANLARLLVRRGDEVRCIVRRPNACTEGLPVSLHTEPMLDTPAAVDALARVLDGCDGIYHLAGTFDPGPGGLRRMRAVHVYATRALLRAADKAGVRRMVLCSSSITVGFGSLAAPGDEDTPLDPDALFGRGTAMRGYYDTKRQAEHLGAAWGSVEVVTVNPDYIIGPWDVKPTSGQLIVAVGRRRMPVYPQGGKCFQRAEDTALGHVLAMERGKPGRRYLLGSHNLKYRAFLGLVADEIGARPPMFPLPDVAVRAAGRAGSWLQSRDPHRFAGMDARVLRAMQQDRFRTGARAETELGLKPSPIELGIKEAVQWFTEHGYF